MAEKIEVKVPHRFTASAERMYDAWLDSDKVRVWMKTAGQSMGLAGDIRQVEIDPRVDGAFLLSDMRDGVETKYWARIWSWIARTASSSPGFLTRLRSRTPGRVSLVIQPDGTGCVATTVHEMDAKWAAYEKQTKNGWGCMMQATDAFLET